MSKRDAAQLWYSFQSQSWSAIFCPITSQVKGYPFEVTIASGSKLGGVILAGQVNCVP
jgi:mRNA interferase MazF